MGKTNRNGNENSKTMNDFNGLQQKETLYRLKKRGQNSENGNAETQKMKKIKVISALPFRTKKP